MTADSLIKSLLAVKIKEFIDLVRILKIQDNNNIKYSNKIKYNNKIKIKALVDTKLESDKDLKDKD